MRSMDERYDSKRFFEKFTAPAAEELCRKLDDGRVECLACGHRCKIADGHSGICRVRRVIAGTLRRPSGYVVGLACDPIEKKPFYHAYPGRDALTFGMLGCNLHCPFCQNWETSQALREAQTSAGLIEISAEELVQAALSSGARAVISSYNEPLITADWAVDVFRLAKPQGLACGFVSNGHATPEALSYLRPHADLFKVDLKSFREETYRRLGGRLSNVLESIQRAKELGFWVEVVTLVVPGLNDDPGELRAMAQFLKGVDPDIPWHVTAFHPDYQMLDSESTPLSKLFQAWEIGKESGLRFVYPGNLGLASDDRENTYCPHCSELLVRRRGFSILENRMKGGACPRCGRQIPGRWEDEPPRRSSGWGWPRRVNAGRRILVEM